MAEGRGAVVSVAGLALLVALSAVGAPLAGARPAHEIPVATATGNLSGPTAEGWSDVPSSTVPLTSAPSSVPNANDTTVERLHVQAARGDGRLYLRLRWRDATRDTAADGPRTFSDSVAVQFPVDTASRPPIAMGAPDNRANVWYWDGAAGGQELLAGGAGSTTAFPNASVSTAAVHRGSGANATWTVVYEREVGVTDTNRTTVPDDRNLDVAFAVWNGSNGERAGQKAVSEWHYFPFGGGPPGPPYEVLLWAVAGIAVVVVLSVTAYGVRHSGGPD
ncbi:ethylbenzene dehydrogenase-related protein [Haloarcula sp. S1CR25-12]|uniref:Ethylbenzene dehydrogenase-related protein n=1 Tax=Haloarcula saliterrae TaxID=2950534 RepID=A0ABU2FH18_9EURY|nr:ethylbenzene dehydrogenase-related protein [Haloarcula sp. S1CR25-12]MDS0261228.1 ethylbenzene dehydrogenase-related protein [Haloarcula sp. S1CR25-12]